MAPKKDPAVSFEDIIKKARERRKHQQFTTEFFQRTRQKKSQPGAGVGGSGGGKAAFNPRSLENRISSASGNKHNRVHKARTAPQVNGNVTSAFVPKGPIPKGPRHDNKRQAMRNQQRAQMTPASSATAGTFSQPFQAQPQAPQPQASFSIRGAASGPCTVLGSNFAPGTTAADIQSAFEPEGGPMLSCVLVNTYPMVVAEMVFAERAGAEAIVAKFNNQKADGRILHIRISPNSIYGTAVPTAPMAMSSNLSYESTREWANRERRERERKSVMDGRLYY
ncbi:hypothetical protein KEM56_001448 [Ascosphaera pollenicola]|nr:hypothetical protein KEM56_001448 [Ascosphaera pollenicola]